MRSLPLLRLLAALALVATTTGCPENWPFPPDTYLGMPCSLYRDEKPTVHVEVRFVDPRLVVLSAGDGPPLLPAGSGPAEAPFASGTQSTGSFSSGTYSIRARREADGALALIWSSDMPLPKGARQVLVSPQGAIEDLRVKAEDVGLPAMVTREPFDLRLCIDVGSARYGGVVPGSHALTAVALCEGAARLTTPWSNVALVREVTSGTTDYRSRPEGKACHLPPPLPDSERVFWGHIDDRTVITRP
jgi:hypothetical protein